jgi:hypothetical protein
VHARGSARRAQGKKEMKEKFLFLLIICNMSLFGQNQDIYDSNHTIQNILKKYNASYDKSFDAYLNDQYGFEPKINGSVYSIENKVAYSFVRELQKRNRSGYAFKIEENFGYNKEQDKVAIINETDQIQVLRDMGIQGNDFEISNDDVVKWFVKWGGEFEYKIIGVGIDFIQADIITEPKDYDTLAKEIYSMCPDVVDQGTNTVEELAKEIKKQKVLYFWWD